MSHIYIIHENPEWTAPLRAALNDLGLPCREWFIDGGPIDRTGTPPHGVFYNRMSASAHSRGHRYAPEETEAVLEWLESHYRRVINSRRALQLEISKLKQYAALNAQGIRTPRTIAAATRAELISASGRFDGPFIIKHNRGGKGLGVRLFDSRPALRRYIESSDYQPPVDGITLVQEYIDAPEPFITRCEFIGGEFFYAVRVDTTQGFELCPADACQLDDASSSPTAGTSLKFRIENNFSHPILDGYARFLHANRIHIAGIEFILDGNGEPITYDVNINTNYNRNAETAAGVDGMRAIAAYLGGELQRVNESLQG